MTFAGLDIDTSQMTSEQVAALEEYIAAITPEPVPVLPEVSTMKTIDLENELAQLIARKCWNVRYTQVDREIQDRATRRWVHDDVFGNTYALLDGEYD